MAQRFKFSLWTELSNSEQELVQEWVGLTLRGRKIRESLLNQATASELNADSDNEDDEFAIVASDEESTAIPLERIAPRVTTFVRALKANRQECNNKCQHLTGNDKKRCIDGCLAKAIAMMF